MSIVVGSDGWGYKGRGTMAGETHKGGRADKTHSRAHQRDGGVEVAAGGERQGLEEGKGRLNI